MYLSKTNRNIQCQNIFLSNDRTNKKRNQKTCWLFSPFIFLTPLMMGGLVVEIASQDFDMKQTQGQICDE